jgi:predicted transcriptional regulator YheO
MPSERDVIFSNLRRIAVEIVNMFGKNYEVAIHGFSMLPHSTIHIEGEVTKRKIGAPITDLAIKQLRAEGEAVNDISNYRTITKEGRISKSFTAFIRDTSGKVIGAFCTNFDITDYLNTVTLVNEFVQSETNNDPAKKEMFASSLTETIQSLIEPIIQEIGKQPVSMTREERIKLLQDLDYQGVFLLRGAVDFLSKLFGVSKFTVYNYLKEIRS